MNAIAEIRAIHHSNTEVDIPQKYKDMLDKVTTTNTMPLAEFIAETKFDIDPAMAEMFFMNLRDDAPVYISDDATIKFMGYSGPIKKGRQQLAEMIERNFVKCTHYWRFSNTEYCEWLKSLSPSQGGTQSTIQQSDEKALYPPVPTGRGTGRVTHLIVTADTFREIMMMIQTPIAPRIRRFYIQLEKLVREYIRYECTGRYWTTMTDVVRNCRRHGRKYEIAHIERCLYHRQRVGCVYFIKDTNTGYTKIDWCWYLPRRLSQLQIGNPGKLVAEQVILAQQPWVLEDDLHTQHDHCRVRGEWFDLR